MAVSKTTGVKKTALPKTSDVTSSVAAVKKPAAKKAAAPKIATPKTTATKTTTARKAKSSNGHTPSLNLSAEERYKMTEVAAYYLAERNGFQGNPGDYWREAEAQVAHMLGR